MLNIGEGDIVAKTIKKLKEGIIQREDSTIYRNKYIAVLEENSILSKKYVFRTEKPPFKEIIRLK